MTREQRTALGNSFLINAAMTAITFFIVGFVRGNIVDARPLASGMEILLIGSSAAAVA